MLSIKEIRVNHRLALLGLDDTPSFSWKLDSTNRHTVQEAYSLSVLCEGKMIWTTGRTESDQSVAVRYTGEALTPLTAYQVILSVWDQNGETACGETQFETGILDVNDFKAQWITHTLPKDEIACPVFTKSFDGSHAVQARLLVSACGVYQAQLNGQAVSEDLLCPGWTNYRKRVQYQTYDVTPFLRGSDTLNITVAPGWYSGYLNGEGKNAHYGDRVAAFAELHLWDVDGRHEIIGTDESWQFTTGETRFAELYHGETIDHTMGESAYQPVALFDGMSNDRLIAQQGPCVRVTQRIAPVALIHTPKGETVLDFGQNIAGVVEVCVDGLPGQKIVLRHAEVLDRDGNFYTTNLRTARATDTYICKGGVETFRPRFTFHGFRYVAVEGMGDTPDLSAFTACAMSSAVEWASSFHCSHPLVNRLFSNISWSMLDNFVDIPTDCPQRDERLGWTGDAAIFCHTAGLLADTYLFFQKWLGDLASEQTRAFGLPDTIPNILMPPGTPSGGSAVWGDSATLVPWAAYQHSGDPDILARQYDSMKDWVEYIRHTETPDHLHLSGHQRGDWLALDREEGKGSRGATDPYLISTAFYAHSTEILAKSAAILGYSNDAEEYGKLFEEIKAGFQREFITENGRLVSETQTACALTLCLGLAKPEHEARIIKTLADNLSRHQNHLTTGFIGTPYLCQALSRFGRHDLAGALLLDEDYPGWLNEVKLGATTIWERWDSMHADGTFDESGMNSFNHYSFGAVGTWLIEELAGLRALEPGYKKILMKPQFVVGITDVSASHETPYGLAAISWACKNGTIKVDVTVPVNTLAEVHLPEQEEPRLLGGGTYHFEYATSTRLDAPRYDMNSTIGVLVKNERFVHEIEKIMPGAGQGLRMEFMQSKTLAEAVSMMPGPAAAAFAGILDALNEAG